jgi:hypothetical protein
MLLNGRWEWLNYDPSCACIISVHSENLMVAKNVLRPPSERFEGPPSMLLSSISISSSISLPSFRDLRLRSLQYGPREIPRLQLT